MCPYYFIINFISDVAETVTAAGRTSIKHLTGKSCKLVAKLLIITERLTVLLFMVLHVCHNIMKRKTIAVNV